MRFISKLIFVAFMSLSAAFAASSQMATLDVGNMTCSLCPFTIKKAFEKVPGVESAKIDFEQKTAVIKYDPAKVNTATLAKVSTEAGFPATERK